MNPTLAFILGAGVGLVAARFLIQSDSCCNRVAAGVRDKAGDALGGWAQTLGDALGVWDYTPGLLDFFGVK